MGCPGGLIGGGRVRQQGLHGLAGSVSYRLLGGLPHLCRLLRRRVTNGVSYEAPDVRLCEGGPICARGGRLGQQHLLLSLRRGVVPCLHREAAYDIAVNTVDRSRPLPLAVQPCPGQH